MQPSSSITHTRTIDMLSMAFGSAINQLMQDKQVVEIMLNPDGKVWVERLSDGIRDSGHHVTAQDAERVVRLIASYSGQECNDRNPSLAAVIPGCGSRFQGLLPPVVQQPCFTIRKKALQLFTLQDYVDKSIMEAGQLHAIRQAVEQRHNILVVGGTGTGKTTLTNAILAEISQVGHRIVVIEDTPELQCTAPNHLTFHTHPPIYTMQQAVKDALRCRPDRIVVGEVRDGAALDLLKAWNTGHNGGVATIHANGPVQGLIRLEQLIQEVVVNVPRELIAEAINIIVYMERDAKTGRKVQQVAEVIGVEGEKYVLKGNNGSNIGNINTIDLYTRCV